MTLHAVFYDWLESFLQRRDELEEAAGRIFGNSRRIVMRNTLAAMKAYASQRQEAKAKMTQAKMCLYRSVLVKTMRVWHADAQETGGQKRRVEEKRKQAMYRFANRCASMSFSRWASGTRRRKQVAGLAAAAQKTLSLAIKKDAFGRLRENVMLQAQERVQTVASAIAWSVAVPGKIGMWPTLLRQTHHPPSSAAPVHSLTQEAAESLAAFGKANFNNAMLHGLTIGAMMTAGDASSPGHRRRHKELSPLAREKTSRIARHMELRPDSGDDEEEDARFRDNVGADCDYNVRSVTGSMLPLPIGSNILLPHASSIKAKATPTAPLPALAPVRTNVQHLGSLSSKHRKVDLLPDLIVMKSHSNVAAFLDAAGSSSRHRPLGWLAAPAAALCSAVAAFFAVQTKSSRAAGWKSSFCLFCIALMIPSSGSDLSPFLPIICCRSCAIIPTRTTFCINVSDTL